MTDQHTTVIDDLFEDDDLEAETIRRRPTSTRRWRILAGIAGIAAVAAIGFALGRTTADDSPANAPAAGFAAPDGAAPGAGAGGPGGMGGGGAGGFGGRAVTGELTAIDGDEWLVTDSTGNTIRIRLSDDTSYRKTEAVTEDDVAIGDNVTVVGEEQDDGSVEAASVQSGDSGMPAFGGGARGARGGRGAGSEADPPGDDTP